MKYLKTIIFFGLISSCFAQGYKPKTKKKDFFGGAKDYRSLANYGLMVQLGPTFTIPSKPQTISSVDALGQTFDGKITPSSQIAGHIDIGMAHFNVKKPKLRIGKLYHYFDYGLNFKVFGGKEQSEISVYDVLGREVSTTKTAGKFYNGYVGLRTTIHYLKYFQNGNKFLDNGLGVNGEYLVMVGKKNYTPYTISSENYSKNLRVQLHYNLGFGFRLKRGSYLVPNVQIPILGLSEFGHESIRWFSSKYFPVMVSIKLIRLFEKKGNGCTDNGTEEDKKKNQEYLQGK